ncbi:MAG: sigma 54-interacting transcriptional regulator [Thermodesulfobacteriota bacterium]
MPKNRLTADERMFFQLVQQAVLANPFSEKRAETDMKIAGLFPGSGRTETIEKAIREVRAGIDRLHRAGRGKLDTYSGADREMLMAACLFDVFHLFVAQLDGHITDQVSAGARPLPVPFAGDMLRLFVERGFAEAEAVGFFALCFQIRRAYFFIDHGLVGRSPCMKKLRESLWNNVFSCDMDFYRHHLWNRMEDFSTLILGETGTGKGAAAKAIGSSGFIPFDPDRKRFRESFTAIFVSLNLSQFPENLIESELFGHRKGAFTGAVEAHEGILGQCSAHGSIFLDEIGEVSEPVQIKLLNVLEERTFTPVGSHEIRRFQGRIIAATNRSLESIQSGNVLRDDFFYRLCSDIIEVPSLRRRIAEDPGELDDLLTYTIEKVTGKPSPDVTAMVRKIIAVQPGMDYAWPGNVRELGQCVRRVMLRRSYGTPVSAVHFPEPNGFSRFIEEGELDARGLVREYCRYLYKKSGTYGEVARRTGLDRRTVKSHVEGTAKAAR